MMNRRELLQAACYEMKFLLRGWSFWLLLLLTLGGVTFFQGVIQSTWFGAARWSLVALPCSMPFLNAWVFNIVQVFLLLFIIPDLFPPRESRGPVESLHVRPFENGNFLLGKLLGVACWFLIFNFLCTLICFGVNLFASVSPVSPTSYLFYLLTLTLPTLVFTSGLAFFLASFARRSFFVKAFLFGLLVTAVVYLPGKHNGLTDFTGNSLPNVFSDVTGHVALPTYLLHRTAYLLLGVALAFLGARRWERLPNHPSERRRTLALGLGVFLLGLTAWGTLALSSWHREHTRAAYRASHARHTGHAGIHVAHHAIVLEQRGNTIVTSNTLTINTITEEPTNTITLYLNPGLRVKSVREGSKELQHERDNQVLLIHRPLLAGDTAILHLAIEGPIDARFANLDLSSRQLQETSRNAHFLRFGRQTAFVDDDFLLLTPASCWYPSAFPPVDPLNELASQRDYTRYELRVVHPAQPVVLSQGLSTREGDTLRFTPSNPLSGISVCGGDYEFLEFRGEKYTARFGYFRGHDFFKAYFPTLTRYDLQGDWNWNRSGFFQEQPLGTWWEEQYPVFHLLEVPANFQSDVRASLGHGDGIQPGMLFFPERGVDIDLRAPFGRQLVVLTEKEKQLDKELRNAGSILYKSIYSPTITINISHPFLDKLIKPKWNSFDHLQSKPNPFSIHPILNGNIWVYSSEYPFLNSIFNWTEKPTTMAKSLPSEENNAVYRYLWGKSPREVLQAGEAAPDGAIRATMEDLLARWTVGISRESFYAFLKKFRETNRGKVVPLEVFLDSAEHQLGTRDLLTKLKTWYTTPYLARIKVEDCKYIMYYQPKTSPGEIPSFGDDKERAKRDFFKNRTVTARFRNDGTTEGIVTILLGYWDPQSYRTYSFTLRPGEAKEISSTDHFHSFEIGNLGVSGFIPVTLNTRNVIVNEDVLAQSEKPAEAFRVETIDPGLLDKTIPGEVIVDDAEPDFHLETDERLLLKLFQKDMAIPYGFAPKSSMRLDVRRWTAIENTAAYGSYSRTLHYKLGGTGRYRAIWKTRLAEAGRYEIFALMYNNLLVDEKESEITYHYTIRHGSTTREVIINDTQECKKQNVPPAFRTNIKTSTPSIGTWKSLGTFDLPSGEVEVVLSDKGKSSYFIIADAVKWKKVE